MKIQQNENGPDATTAPGTPQSTSKNTQTATRSRNRAMLSAIRTKEGRKGLIKAKQSVVKSKHTNKTKKPPSRTVATSDYDITYQGGTFSIELCHDELEELEIKKIERSYEDIRKHLANNYNWNAIVKIMKFCSKNDPDFTYKVPTNLSGTEQDNKLIMPDAGMFSIVRLQLDHALTNAKAGFSEYSEVLDSITEKIPEPDFITQIMCEPSQNDLMNEEDNDQMKNERGQQIPIPQMNASPDVLYKNLRALVQARNGLWSDKANVTNIVGIRRKLSKNETEYDDSLIACWVDAQGTKYAKAYSATTEPGEINNHRQMTAQTLTVIPGYHFGRQPAGRTSKFLARNAGNSKTLKFVDDPGFNFHHGGERFEGKKKNGLTSERQSKTDQQVAINLLYVQAFTILSRWGKKQNVNAYDYLEEMKDIELYKFQEMKDGKVDMKRDSDKEAVSREVESLKTHLAGKYAAEGANRDDFVRIIQSVDSEFKKPEKLAELKAADLKKLITDEHIKGILKKQMNYFAEAKDIDGKPGPSYLDILDGKTDQLTKLKSNAQKDYTTLEAVFKKLQDTYSVKDASINYMKQLKPGTQNERESYDKKTGTNTDHSTKIERNVSVWSEGCQVVFGAEKFYEFWTHVTDKATTTKQKRWYYTLIDEESFKTTTQQGETE